MERKDILFWGIMLLRVGFYIGADLTGFVVQETPRYQELTNCVNGEITSLHDLGRDSNYN